MNKILLIEDDDSKAKKIINVISQVDQSLEIIRANCISKAVNILDEPNDIGLILLDVGLPTWDNSEIFPYGGIEVLCHLTFEKNKIPTVIITAYTADEITEKLKSFKSHSDALYEFFRGVIQFDHFTSKWEDELADVIMSHHRVLCGFVDRFSLTLSKTDTVSLLTKDVDVSAAYPK